MIAVTPGQVCLCLLLQLAAGKSLDFQYGYQEIEDSLPMSETRIEETKNLEFDQLSDEAVEEICKNFKATIHIKNPDTHINCLEPFFDRTRSVVLVKRDADLLEGSGDPDEPTAPKTSEKIENKEEPVGEQNKSETAEIQGEVLLKTQLKPVDSQAAPSTANPVIATGNPGSFEGGFDNILKNNAKVQNNTLEDMKSPPAVLNSALPNEQIDSNGEEAKTGESQEKPTAASPNNMLLIVIGAIGVIGALAFIYNFIRSKKESREIDDAIQLETEGKELKEMKPLMKSPLAQNGSKSMEYIDADPQIQVQTETRVEVN